MKYHRLIKELVYPYDRVIGVIAKAEMGRLY